MTPDSTDDSVQRLVAISLGGGTGRLKGSLRVRLSHPFRNRTDDGGCRQPVHLRGQVVFVPSPSRIDSASMTHVRLICIFLVTPEIASNDGPSNFRSASSIRAEYKWSHFSQRVLAS